jgi:hypothetical protein
LTTDFNPSRRNAESSGQTAQRRGPATDPGR